MQRAKVGLNIRSRRVEEDGRPVSYWLLPGQSIPTRPGQDSEFDRFIAEMEKRFPPRTPLDDPEDEEEREET